MSDQILPPNEFDTELRRKNNFGSQRSLDFGNSDNALRTCIIIPTLHNKLRECEEVSMYMFYKCLSSQGDW